MKSEGRIVAFAIQEPFDVALRMLRRALAMEGFECHRKLMLPRE